MEAALGILEQFGLGIGILLSVGIGIYRAAPVVWTWVTKQIEDIRDQQREMYSSFSATMQAFNETIQKQNAESLRSDDRFAALVDKIDTSTATQAARALEAIERNGLVMDETRKALDRNSDAFKETVAVLRQVSKNLESGA